MQRSLSRGGARCRNYQHTNTHAAG